MDNEKKKILIVDDDEFILTIAELGLKRAGFDVVKCSSGLQTLKVIKSNEKLKDISEYLEDFFFKSYIENHKGPYNSTNLISQEEINEVLDNHFEYLKLASDKKDYFDKLNITQLIPLLKKILCLIGGAKLIHFLKIKKISLRKICT